jgi:hypothetical protein
MQLDQLAATVQHLKVVIYTSSSILGVVALGLAVTTYNAHEMVNRVARERPVIVVPGAVAGQYIAGLGEENLIGAARYITSLGASFTLSTYESRAKELLEYADPVYEAVLKNSQRSQRDEVLATGQARSFHSDRANEQLRRVDANTFEYSAKGNRVVYAGGLVVAQDVAQVKLTFRLGFASEKNRFGLTVIGLDVSTHDTGSRQNPSQATAK